MELKEIKKIIEMMSENELTRFRLEREDFHLEIERRREHEHVVVSGMPAPSAIPMAAPPPPSQAVPQGPAAAESEAAANNLEGLIEIKSPIVGTFYRSSSPDSDPFVTTGSEVNEDTVVCIIEAMKVMNEINAEVRGVIRKILIENAAPVQFGQPLFLVEPR